LTCHLIPVCLQPQPEQVVAINMGIKMANAGACALVLLQLLYLSRLSAAAEFQYFYLVRCSDELHYSVFTLRFSVIDSGTGSLQAMGWILL
jgi:hypothetical protein